MIVLQRLIDIYIKKLLNFFKFVQEQDSSMLMTDTTTNKIVNTSIAI